MLERVKDVLTNYLQRAEFFDVVGQYFPVFSDEHQLILRAYNVAKDAFRNIEREDGKRYFEHVRGVALILMVYLRVRDANLIAAALLHDIIEDKDEWTEERIAAEFNQRVAELVKWVTKPDLRLFDGDKDKRNRVYHTTLANAPREAICIKMCDRLHNVLELWACPVEKQERKIRETLDFYLPLAEKHTILIHELEVAIQEIKTGSNPDSQTQK